jgi:hypothetical protein
MEIKKGLNFKMANNTCPSLKALCGMCFFEYSFSCFASSYEIDITLYLKKFQDVRQGELH